ncbi:thiosulfate/3-mercaptopyruvate sulfurtransferase [Alkalibacillus flavidus]|uniref:Thiosulfate/3-mercaptopyruvate sulfurtransferase n=1 Tax=Alkalibacillus flavidus TaxID=546021 RepID=A0ABV2KRV4_9BACI
MIISVEEAKRKSQNEDVVFVDCRFDLKQPDQGRKWYDEAHLPNAVYMDLERDLSGEVYSTGGRHPLPDMEQFKQLLLSKGITDKTTVIAYDNQHAFASRFAWMLKAIGHEDVFILNGGFAAWEEAGFHLTSEPPSQDAVKNLQSWSLNDRMIATQDDVQRYIQDDRVALIDSRSYERYIGDHEPIDLKAGHIPSARSFDWMLLFDQGYFKDQQALQQHFSDLTDVDKIVVYCGSGVTAASNVIALWEAGFDHVQLYVGSFSDWISNNQNVVATGDEPV